MELIYPWHFIPAVHAQPERAEELDAEMLSAAAELPKLEGRTVVLVDVSEAMDESAGFNGFYSKDLRRIDLAVGVAVLMRELVEDCRIFTFSNFLMEIGGGLRGFSLMSALSNSQAHMDVHLRSVIRDVCLERHYDRVVIITAEAPDEDVIVPQDVQQGVVIVLDPLVSDPGLAQAGPWTTINGWSDQVPDYIRDPKLVTGLLNEGPW